MSLLMITGKEPGKLPGRLGFVKSVIALHFGY